MHSKTRVAVALSVITVSGFLLAACANQGVSRSDLNQSISVNYGTVVNVSQVPLKSNAGAGAVVGGILGAVIGEDKLASAAIGAAAGGLLTYATEGRKTANSYTVNLTNGAETKVVTEANNIRVGDCVAVEQGSSANIRVVSSANCQYVGHPALSEPAVQTHAQQEASGCQTAKNEALAATNEQQMDLATKKVRVLCEN